MPRIAAGLLMYRIREGELQLLLAHPGGPYFKNKDDGSWTIPKGEIEPDEELLEAAKREFEEETGVTPTGSFIALTPIKQKGGKIVHAWAFEGDCNPSVIVSNTFTMEWPPKSGRLKEFPEIDRADFFNVAAAKRKIKAGQEALIDELDEIVKTQEQLMVEFIPAVELQARFDVYGHFYCVKVAPKITVECRSVLEIVEQSHAPKTTAAISKAKPDAIFVMMNPGSSKPLVEVNNRINADAIHELTTTLVSTKPDTTQYQVMRLMHFCEWRHVRVLNLSDLRCSKSVEFFKQFRRLEEDADFDSHSVFSAKRKKELAAKLTKHTDVPVIRAWGLSPKLDPLIERCTRAIKKHKLIRGLMKEGSANKFLHPLPSLQSQKLVWVNRMVEQCLQSAVKN